MATGRLLIIAPDADLRRSLEFLLVAEGYSVTSHADISDISTTQTFACTIVDHQAISNQREEMRAFCQRARPIVLLAGSTPLWLAEQAFRVVQKPLLGRPLLSAIKDAVTLGARHPKYSP